MARASLLGSMAALLLASPAEAREKTDVVVLANGDSITGEIKGMTRGQLDFNTSDAGRPSIKWLKVTAVTSPFSYEVELSSGVRYYGSLRPPPPGEQGLIVVGDHAALAIPDVVAITPLDAGLLSRTQAYLDLGFTVAKSNWAMTLTADGEVAYRGERFGTTLDFDVYAQDDQSSTAVNRSSVQLQEQLFFNRWRPLLIERAERNDELSLRLRMSLGGGAAYDAVRTNSTTLSVLGGLQGIYEEYTTRAPGWNLDAAMNVTWEAFRYDSPKLDTTVGFTVYPGLTELGRFRGELTVRVKYELFSDFNVGLTFTDSFDTRPPEATASNNDFVASFTIGWKYRR